MDKLEIKLKLFFPLKLFISMFFLSISVLLIYLWFTEQISTIGLGVGGAAGIGIIVLLDALKERKAHNQENHKGVGLNS